jgi:hypothetical protein
MPAIGMIVYGGLGLIAAVVVLATVSIIDAFDPMHRDILATWVAGCLMGGSVAAVVLAAGIKMRNLDNFDFVVAGAIVTLLTGAAMFPAIVAVPLGIWSLALLRTPGMRQVFALQRTLRKNDPRTALQSQVAGPAWGLVGGGLVSVLGPLLFILFADLWSRSHLLPGLAGIPIGLVMLIGGLAMLRLGPYELAKMGAIAGLLPCSPAWLLTLPAGLVGLIVLRRSSVETGFSRLVESEVPDFQKKGAPFQVHESQTEWPASEEA